MKNFSGTAFFAVVVIAIGGFAFYEYQKSEKEKEEKTTEQNLLRGLVAENVTEFNFTSDKQTYTLKKENDVWLMLSPVADTADEEVLLTHIRNVASINVEPMDIDNAAGLTQYGLDSPLATISMTVSTAKEPITLRFGRVRTYDDGYYIKKNEDANLYVGADSLSMYIDKSPQDFRSKKIQFPPGEILDFKIQSQNTKKSGQYSFAKQNGDWESLEKKKTRLAANVINNYVNDLIELKADAVAGEDQSKAELSRLGLIKPELKIALNIKPNDGPAATVEVKFSSPKNTIVYLAASENKPIYQITQARYEEFLKTLDDFRDKSFPFAFNHADATSFKIKNDLYKDELILNKSADKWVDAKVAEKIIKQDEVTSALGGLASLTAEEFLPTTTRAQFKNSYVFINAAGQEYFQIYFGKTQKTKGGTEAYLTKTSLSEELMLVDKAKVDEILNKAFND